MPKSRKTKKCIVRITPISPPKKSMVELIGAARYKTERLKVIILQSVLDELHGEEIGTEFVENTPIHDYSHLSSKEQKTFQDEEQKEILKRDGILRKYRDEILVKQAFNLQQQLHEMREQLAELEAQYPDAHAIQIFDI